MNFLKYFFEASSPCRRLQYKELATIELHGKVIDLGGSRKSGYHEIMKGSKEITVVNFDSTYGFDLNQDLEKPLEIESHTYDSVLCINTLEHVYNHAQLVSEARRIMKKDGIFVVAVPFLMYVHPCPHDHWRYTGETLQRLLEEAGFKNVEVTAVGKGPFVGALQIIYPALKFSLIRNIAYACAQALDYLACFKFKDGPKQFALGYVVKART